MMEPFRFFSMSGLVRSTGNQALDLVALREGVAAVSDACIYHHLHHALLRRHFQAAGVVNDFARWVAEELGDPASAERIGAVDPVALTSIPVARQALLDALARSIHLGSSRARALSPFRFAEVVTFLIPTGIEAGNLEQLLEGVERTDLPSIFVHFVDASLHKDAVASDFGAWLRVRGEHDLAAKVDLLTPYAGGLDGVRAALIQLLADATQGVVAEVRP
jgi:hypothetical protein